MKVDGRRWDEWVPKQCKSCGQDFHFKPLAESPAWARSGDQWFHPEDTKFLCVRCHKEELIGGPEDLPFLRCHRVQGGEVVGRP